MYRICTYINALNKQQRRTYSFVFLYWHFNKIQLFILQFHDKIIKFTVYFGNNSRYLIYISYNYFQKKNLQVSYWYSDRY